MRMRMRMRMRGRPALAEWKISFEEEENEFCGKRYPS